MENLQLILVTVLITLVSVAVVGSIAYLVAVVRKLRQVVKDNVVDITNLQNALNGEVVNIKSRIEYVADDLDKRIKEVDVLVTDSYTDLDRKLDSRCDKLYDGYNKELENIHNKMDVDIESLREMTRQALGLKK
jgi:uncharacterized membrane protein